MSTSGTFGYSSTDATNAFCDKCGMQGRGVHYMNCPELVSNFVLTEAEVRRIVREELARAAPPQPERHE